MVPAINQGKSRGARAVVDSLKWAGWLNDRRLRAYPVICLAIYIIVGSIWISMGEGLLDPLGKPIGTDFSTIWAAGDLALEGRAPQAYDPEILRQKRADAFNRADMPYSGWLYPPAFLVVAMVLAFFPYLAALLVWLAATIPLYLSVIYKILPNRTVIWAGLGFPGFFINLAHGQNGFLSVALLGGGLSLLNRQPVLAGILFGAMTYKPQLGLLIPLVLIATGRWNVFFAATVTAVIMAWGSYAVFGLDTWVAFIEGTAYSRQTILETGATGWAKLQSTFAAMRMLGGNVGLAYLLQAVVSIAVAGISVWLWRKRIPFPLQGAVLVVGLLMANPYIHDYDLVILALPIVWIAGEGLRTGFLAWEKTMLIAVWLLPLFARVVGTVAVVPLSPLIMGLLMAVIVRRALIAPQQEKRP